MSLTKLNIISIIVLFVSCAYFLGAPGTSDTVFWSKNFRDTIGKSPIESHIITDNIYPPFSTYIMSFFANSWKAIFGPSTDYAIAIKISILSFYLLGLFSFILFHRLIVRKSTLSYLDLILLTLTTFSLMINSLSLTYVDFYVIPFLIFSFYLMYRKSYFWAGILLSTSALIKWQPLVLLPLFGSAIFDIRENLKSSFDKSIKFMLGFLPLYLLTWWIMWITPGGAVKIKFAMNFFLHPPNLSGNALNLSWILTYFLHIFNPDIYLPLRNGTNWLIRAATYPHTAYLFYLAALVIIICFWLRRNKTIQHLLSACSMLYFSHYILNRGVHEQHLFYTVIMTLFLYLTHPTKNGRRLLILFDIMNLINLVLFYGFVGNRIINPLFLGFDLTVAFASFNVIIYFIVLKNYLKSGSLLQISQ